MSPRKTIESAVEILRTQATVIDQAADAQELDDAIHDIEVALESLRSVTQKRPAHTA